MALTGMNHDFKVSQARRRLKLGRCAKFAFWTLGIGMCFINGFQSGPTPAAPKEATDQWQEMTAIDAFARAVQWQKALVLGRQALLSEVDLNVAEYTTVLNTLGRGRQWHLAAELFRQMPTVRIEPTVVTYNALINACTTAKCWQQALGWFSALADSRALRQPTVITYNSLINALNVGSRWPEALLAWQKMQDEGLQPTAATISSLCRQGQGSLRLLSLCEEAGVRPDLVLCNILLDNCQRQLLWQRAIWLLEEMPSKLKIPPDEVSYNSAINALELSKKSWPLAVQLLQKMRASSLKPSIITYNCTMAATEKSSVWERTLSLWDSLHEDGIVPSKAPGKRVTGDVILTALSSSSKWLAMEFVETRPSVLAPAGLAAAWSSCEENHHFAASQRLQEMLRRKVEIGRVWHHSSFSILLQGTALWWCFLWKLFRLLDSAGPPALPLELQEAVLPSAAARLWSERPMRLSLCHLAWHEMTGAVSLPAAPTLGLLPVAFDVVLDAPSFGSMTLGPVVVWASVSDKMRRALKVAPKSVFPVARPAAAGEGINVDEVHVLRVIKVDGTEGWGAAHHSVAIHSTAAAQLDAMFPCQSPGGTSALCAPPVLRTRIRPLPLPPRSSVLSRLPRRTEDLKTTGGFYAG
eukprot:s179_g17.t1